MSIESLTYADHRVVTGRTLTLSKPKSSSYRPRSLSLKQRKAPLKPIAAGHRADFERERERSDKLMTNTMTLAVVAMSARAKAARLIDGPAFARSCGLIIGRKETFALNAGNHGFGDRRFL
jgi:hypothetical protein